MLGLHEHESAAMMGSMLRLLRTPLLLSAAMLYVLLNPALIPNLIVWANTHSPERSTWGAMSVRLDYLLYLPNVVVFLAACLGVLLLIEIKRMVLPHNTNVRHDLATAGLSLLLALLPLGFVQNAKSGGLQLIMSGAQVGLLWFWMLCNAGLYTVERFIARHRWCARVLDWTFPLSDILCYRLHRERTGQTLGPLRLLPSACYGLMLVAALWLQGRILVGAIRAERVDIPAEDVYMAIHAADGFWFSNGDWWDPASGIWHYDERSRTAWPYIRGLDVRRFCLDGGYFYYHDRYDNAVYKVDADTRRIAWQVSTQPAGTFEVLIEGDVVFAVGEGGSIVVMTKDGRVLARREFYRTWAPQALPGGQVVFVTGDRRVHIWDRRLESADVTLLPLPTGVRNFEYQPGHKGIGAVTIWTDYDERAGVFYAATLWGGIFRYDVQRRVWLPAFQAAPGLRSLAIDNRHGLLFAWNYFQGYIEVMDLETGEHLDYILANALGRFMNLDPVTMRGIVSTHGYGLYRFEYGEIVRRRTIR